MTTAFHFDRFEAQLGTRQLLANNERLPLGARAFDVLVALIERRERIVTKQELLDVVWPGLVVEENNLQVQSDRDCASAVNVRRWSASGTWISTQITRNRRVIISGRQFASRMKQEN